VSDALVQRLRGLFRSDPGRLRPFAVDGTAYGGVEHAFALLLSRFFGDVFDVDDDRVTLRTALADPAARTAAVADVTERLQREGWVPRHEPERYPVVRELGDEPALLVDRAFVPFLGVRCFGVHVNGFVETPRGLHVWVGRRSTKRPKSPGRLDHLVAGGLPHGIGAVENLLKESDEEAGIPAEIARRARAVGAFRYRQDVEHGIRDDTLLLYDLEVPADFRPTNRDGEIDDFFLWPAERVLRSLRSEPEDWKQNVIPVVLDFLVRRGVAPADDPAHAVVREGIRR
jgi:hypothetical protein